MGPHISLYNSGGFIKVSEVPELEFDTRRRRHLWVSTLASTLWFYSVKYPIGPDGDFPLVLLSTLCQSKLYNPAALTDPNAPSCTLTTKSHSTKPEHWLCSRGPIYKCLTTDVIRLRKILCVLCISILCCSCFLRDVMLRGSRGLFVLLASRCSVLLTKVRF